MSCVISIFRHHHLLTPVSILQVFQYLLWQYQLVSVISIMGMINCKHLLLYCFCMGNVIVSLIRCLFNGCIWRLYAWALSWRVGVFEATVWRLISSIIPCVNCVNCATSFIYSCWLSSDRGTIWAFIAPMLFIITVSVIIREADKAEHYNRTGSTWATDKIILITEHWDINRPEQPLSCLHTRNFYCPHATTCTTEREITTKSELTIECIRTELEDRVKVTLLCTLFNLTRKLLQWVLFSIPQVNTVILIMTVMSIVRARMKARAQHHMNAQHIVL